MNFKKIIIGCLALIFSIAAFSQAGLTRPSRSVGIGIWKTTPPSTYRPVNGVFQADTSATTPVLYYHAGNGIYKAFGGALADDSVDTQHLKDNSVTKTKIADEAILTQHIADLSITAPKLAAGVLSGAKNYKGVFENLDSANLNAVSSVEGDYVIIYKLSAYEFEEGDVVTYYENPSLYGDSIRSIFSDIRMYSSEALGLAGTTNGEYFFIRTPDGGEVLYEGAQNVGGSASYTGAEGEILTAYDPTALGGLVVPQRITKTYNTASYHRGEYFYNESGYRGQYETLEAANLETTRHNIEGDYVSIIKSGSGFTLSEGDLFTVYQDPDTDGTTLDPTFNNRPMYSNTTVGQANTSASDYYLVQNTATTMTMYQNFGSANFVANGTIGDEYDASVDGRLAIPTTGLNAGADFGYATYTNGSYDFLQTLRITSAERALLTPYFGMQVFCNDCVNNGGDDGMMTIYIDGDWFGYH